MKRLRITIEGKSYEVLVEVIDEAGAGGAVLAPALPLPTAHAALPPPIASTQASPSSSASARGAASAGDVPSPLAGKIVSIDVTIGQAVSEGSQVATIEAMKMNTYIYAPTTGHVSAILVNPGDGVQEGSVLLRIA